MHYNTDSWNGKNWAFILTFEEARRNPIFKENSNSQNLHHQLATTNKAKVWSNKNQTFTWSKKFWMMKFMCKEHTDFGSFQCQYSEAFEIVVIQAEWLWIKSGFFNVPMLSLHMCFLGNNYWPTLLIRPSSKCLYYTPANQSSSREDICQ